LSHSLAPRNIPILASAKPNRLTNPPNSQYISASISTPTITKFLMVSYIASRRGYPSWWNDSDRAAADKVNTEILPAYYQAKVAADEHLAALAHKRGKGFQAINLRPGTLKDGEGTGRVNLGQHSPLLLDEGWSIFPSFMLIHVQAKHQLEAT
jgi:hypothetical protein